MENLKDVENAPNYEFVKGDIVDDSFIFDLFNKYQFEEGLDKTVDWYLENSEWMNHILSGDYEKYYEEQYHKR